MFTSILDSVMNEPSVAPISAAFDGFVGALGDFYPFAVIAICLIVGLFGRRLINVIRFVLLFAIGFVASVYWVAPLLQTFIPDIPALGVGIAVGVLAAAMSRMIYNVVYIGCIGFDVYNICFNAIFLVELTSMTQGNLPLSIGIAAVAVVIALLLRKYLEMLITAAIGGIGIAVFAQHLFDYTLSFNMDPATTAIIFGVVLALPMFIYQYYNRVIY